VNIGTKVVVLPMTHRAPATVAQQVMPAPTSSYAPVSAPAEAWNGIRVRGVY